WGRLRLLPSSARPVRVEDPDPHEPYPHDPYGCSEAFHRLASQAAQASMPHQPSIRTTLAICVSRLRTPRLEKMRKKSCSTKSGSPVVTSGSTWARASAM